MKNSPLIDEVKDMQTDQKEKKEYRIEDQKRIAKRHWEFRTKYSGLQIRILAFWDKSGGEETVVIAALGFIKKGDKVPKNEIERAIKIKMKYFENK